MDEEIEELIIVQSEVKSLCGQVQELVSLPTEHEPDFTTDLLFFGFKREAVSHSLSLPELCSHRP